MPHTQRQRRQQATVASADGTPIGYYTIGSGPALVIVHGSLRSAEDYFRLAGLLADTFTVSVPDRRGRGLSGPQGADYSLQRECEDMTAVVQQTGAHLLFGHSFGGIVGLEVARTSSSLTQLAVYDPALDIDGVLSDESLQELAGALQTHRYGRALLTMFRLVGDPQAQLPVVLRLVLAVPVFERLLFASPAGKRLCTLLQSVVAEGRVSREAGANCQVYRVITAETLLLHGSQSPAWYKRATTRLSQLLPHSQTLQLEGVGHSGPCEDAPWQVADLLKDFFLAREE